MKYDIGPVNERTLNNLSSVVHQANAERGWWKDLHEVVDALDDIEGGDPEWIRAAQQKVKMWFVLSKVALIHTEVSELVEGIRKRTKDDHLPHRDADEVEAADTLIRLLDLCGFLGLDLGGATAEKFLYNQNRSDHKPENRSKVGGKLV